jgi:hypothetical protein
MLQARWLAHPQEWTIEVIEALRDAIRDLGEGSNLMHASSTRCMRAHDQCRTPPEEARR